MLFHLPRLFHIVRKLWQRFNAALQIINQRKTSSTIKRIASVHILYIYMKIFEGFSYLQRRDNMVK